MFRSHPLHRIARRTALAATPILVLAVAFTAAAAMAAAPDTTVVTDSGDAHPRTIRVQAKVECKDGEDCVGENTQVIFVGEDGEVKHLDGEGLHWVSEDGETGGGEHRAFFIGEGGDVHSLDADALTWVGEDGALDVQVDVADGLAHAFAFRHGLDAGGGYLGIGLTELTDELRLHFGAPEGTGVMVSEVMDDSPAWRAGLQAGDVVTRIDGEPVASGGELARAVRAHEAGDTVSLEVVRDGRLETFTASVDERQPKRIEIRKLGGPHLALCGDDGECRVEVRCEDGTCDCTVNGTSADCETLHLDGGE